MFSREKILDDVQARIDAAADADSYETYLMLVHYIAGVMSVTGEIYGTKSKAYKKLNSQRNDGRLAMQAVK